MSDPDSNERRGLLRWAVRWFVAFYYPRIEIAGAELISQTQPVLLCANHGNSLIDPVVIGIAANRPVRFMAKAPLFDHPVLGPPMSALGMVPAFRGSDDAKQVRRNLESLNVGAKVLIDGHAMGIFPEGKSTDHAHLEMIRSGAARMAIQAVEGGAKGLQVVPLGIAYQRKEQFRSSVLVRIAQPIDIDELLQQHEGDSRRARRTLTTELETRLKQVVVHLDEPAWEKWLDDLEILVPPPVDAAKTPGRFLWQRKRIADAMNHFLRHDRQRAESVAGQIEAYHYQLREAGLRIDSTVLRMSSLKALLWLTWNLLLLILFLIPALLGTLHHIIPFVLVRGIASRMDQPGRLTISTHRLLVGVPIYLVWYAAVTLALMLVSSRFAWSWLIVAPPAGLVAVYYWRRAGQTMALLCQELRVLFGLKELKQLRQQQLDLRERLLEMSDEFAQVSPKLGGATDG
jgi:glycerol-3-phosphate O-acyltransferase/dihydroxyacetone phosphate acyltransferase